MEFPMEQRECFRVDAHKAHDWGHGPRITYECEGWGLDADGHSLKPDPTDAVPHPDHEDRVNHPSHYNSHPSGIEFIEIGRHYGFNIGNAMKYLWRAGLKAEDGIDARDKEIEDLKKAVWYINDQIKELEASKTVERINGMVHQIIDQEQGRVMDVFINAHKTAVEDSGIAGLPDDSAL